jgi:hypothetical protein
MCRFNPFGMERYLNPTLGMVKDQRLIGLISAGKKMVGPSRRLSNSCARARGREAAADHLIPGINAILRQLRLHYVLNIYWPNL